MNTKQERARWISLMAIHSQALAIVQDVERLIEIKGDGSNEDSTRFRNGAAISAKIDYMKKSWERIFEIMGENREGHLYLACEKAANVEFPETSPDKEKVEAVPGMKSFAIQVPKGATPEEVVQMIMEKLPDDKKCDCEYCKSRRTEMAEQLLADVQKSKAEAIRAEEKAAMAAGSQGPNGIPTGSRG